MLKTLQEQVVALLASEAKTIKKICWLNFEYKYIFLLEIILTPKRQDDMQQTNKHRASLNAFPKYKIINAGNALIPRKINVIAEFWFEWLVLDIVPDLEERQASSRGRGGGCGFAWVTQWAGEVSELDGPGVGH